MFGLMNAIFPIMFITVVGIIIFSLVQRIITWNKNNQSPRLTVPVVVVAKRENITQHQHANAGDSSGAHGFHTTTSTSYYVTFQVESGDRIELCVSGTEYGMLEFEDGYEKLTEPFEQVEGNITIEGVDFDCTCVMLQSKWGNYGKFNGEKLELERFIKRYKNYSFEIVDELYGYNQVLYSGYLSILETEDLVQMDISIYFTGKIIYDTKE